MLLLVITAATLIILLLLSTVQCIRRLRRGKILAASRSGVISLILLSLAAVAVLAGLNILTYQRLRFEQAVATLSFKQLGSQAYQAKIHIADKQIAHSFTVTGDEWQMDARVVIWRPLANLFGLDALFRLERFAGRYHNLSQARSQLPSVHDMHGSDWVDFIALIKRLPAGMDVQFGSSAYMPMADQARYELRLTQTGLIVRPDNLAAIEAVDNWAP